METEACYYDKNGKEIKQFNLIKMFHFKGVNEQGRGRKNYYMYKWIELKESNGKLFYYAWHLNGNEYGKDSGFFLKATTSIYENRKIESFEIIQ